MSIFWFTGAGASSVDATYEGMQAWRAMIAAAATAGSTAAGNNAPPGPPMGYAVFAADTSIRVLADPTGQVEHWSEYDSGGHFPAMETPDLLSNDIRSFFARLP